MCFDPKIEKSFRGHVFKKHFAEGKKRLKNKHELEKILTS
jgi:hypothetical protein